MAVQNIAQLKKWFKNGAYPTESQFADLIDSFRHKNDKVGLTEVEGLTNSLNKKYDASEGRILETMIARHTTQIDWLNTVQERQAEEIDELEETDEAQQIEINTAKNDIINISNIIKSGGSLDDAKAALEALGENYAGLYALAVTVKTFLETTDTKEATINTWQEIESFLQGVTDNESLAGLLAELEANITEAYNAAISEAMDSSVKMVNVEYSRLVELRGNGELIPGAYYRITDYDTTVANDDVAQCAGHPFDLIVKAQGINILSEEAMAIQSERDVDGYFSSSNLEAWKIWYCLDNDICRFAWADPDNGKGVIYRMIDEWGNDCPFDFKNIMFRRFLCEGDLLTPNNIAPEWAEDPEWQYPIIKYLLSFDGNYYWVSDGECDKWFYTFSLVNRDMEVADASVGTFHCAMGNTIKPIAEIAYLDSFDTYGRVLNNIVLGAVSNSLETEFIRHNYFGDDCYEITIYGGAQGNVFAPWCSRIEGYGLSMNKLGHGCYGIFLGYKSYGNEFQQRCSSIYLNRLCRDNTFMLNCYALWLGFNCCGNHFGLNSNNNDLGDGCLYNVFDTDCYDNSLGMESERNIFGVGCANNTLVWHCRGNIFGNNCKGNNLGYGCDDNHFGAYCEENNLAGTVYANRFGSSCRNNTFNKMCSGNDIGSYCSSNTFMSYFRGNRLGGGIGFCKFNDYIEHISVGDNVEYVDVKGGSGQSTPIKAVSILNGVKGSSSKRLEIAPAESGCCQYVGMNNAGELKIWFPADLIV